MEDTKATEKISKTSFEKVHLDQDELELVKQLRKCQQKHYYRGHTNAVDDLRSYVGSIEKAIKLLAGVKAITTEVLGNEIDRVTADLSALTKAIENRKL